MKLVLSFVIIMSIILPTKAQTIIIKDPGSKPIKGAVVSVQIKYSSTEFLLEKSKEAFFTFVTDTLGKVILKGDFQKDNFEVESIMIKAQHKDFDAYEVITKDYSPNASFTYTLYLVPKNNKMNITGKLTTTKDAGKEIDVYSVKEIADKLGVQEDDIVALIKKGKLRGKKIGEKYFVSGNDLIKYLEE